MVIVRISYKTRKYFVRHRNSSCRSICTVRFLVHLHSHSSKKSKCLVNSYVKSHGEYDEYNKKKTLVPQTRP